MKLNAVTAMQTLDEVIRTGENEKCHCPWTIMYAFIPPPPIASHRILQFLGSEQVCLLIALVLSLLHP